MALTRDAILAAKDIKIEEVSVPEWGGKIYVKGMTGAERDRFESSLIEIRGKKQTTNLSNTRAKLAALTVCEKNGILLFTEADVHALGEKAAAPLNRIFEVARRLSGLSDEDVAELTKELEDPLEGSASA